MPHPSSSSPSWWSYPPPPLPSLQNQTESRKQKAECRNNRWKTIPHFPPSLAPALSNTQAPTELDFFDLCSSQWKLPSKRFRFIYLYLIIALKIKQKILIWRRKLFFLFCFSSYSSLFFRFLFIYYAYALWYAHIKKRASCWWSSIACKNKSLFKGHPFVSRKTIE